MALPRIGAGDLLMLKIEHIVGSKKSAEAHVITVYTFTLSIANQANPSEGDISKKPLTTD